MKTVAFVPIKLNSERLPGKNIKRFTGGEPLISYILNTLLKVKKIDEIFVYCSSKSIIDFLPKGVQFLKRDEYYDLSTTPFNEVLVSFCNLVEADTYLLTHATAPFISVDTFEKGIDAVNVNGYDSAFSACELREFLWKDNRPFNYSLDSIPRTQDLDVLLFETCGMYVFKRDLIVRENRRIGKKYCPIIVSKIEACDINTEEDFVIADAIFNYRLNHH